MLVNSTRAAAVAKLAQKLLNKAIRYRNLIPRTKKPYKTTSPPSTKHRRRRRGISFPLES